jgi:hypothetical protein
VSHQIDEPFEYVCTMEEEMTENYKLHKKNERMKAVRVTSYAGLTKLTRAIGSNKIDIYIYII